MGLTSGLEHIVREAEPLARHTWLGIGGPAQYFAEPTTVDEFATLVKRCREQELPVRLLGGGSNLLISDEGVSGAVVRLAAPAFCDIRVNENTLTAGGGAKLSLVISTAVREGLSGLEDLVGIPGTVGGALHTNSGRQQADIGQFTTSATVMTRSGEIATRGRDDLVFAYRQSSLNELAILEADFELENGDPHELTKRMQKLWIVKHANQPTADQCSGRIFKNLHGVRAADVIEQAGLKGTRVREVEVSERNANYIVAGAGATSNDVTELIEKMKNQVSERLGIELEYEIDVW